MWFTHPSFGGNPMSESFAKIYTWEQRPEWVDALVAKLNTFIADPVYVICWEGHPEDGSEREKCAAKAAEAVAREVFDTGTPWYVLKKSEHGAPCDVVVIVTDS